ncbi:MAG: 4'-phosphopantetheinyl transferase superfamily protein [Luteimonas sp.]
MPASADNNRPPFGHTVALSDAFERARMGAGFDERLRLSAWCFDLAEWMPWLREAEALLDAPERARVQLRLRPGDRDALTLTYALHRLALAAVLECDPSQVALLRDAVGRPCLLEKDIWTSLTHTDGFAAVAISRASAVGIDLELATRAMDMPEIAERVCHVVEADGLKGRLPAEYASALLALWVRKEALLKMAGVGLGEEMNTFQAPADIVVRLPGDHVGHAVVRMVMLGPAWVAAIASDGSGPEIATDWLHP